MCSAFFIYNFNLFAKLNSINILCTISVWSLPDYNEFFPNLLLSIHDLLTTKFVSVLFFFFVVAMFSLCVQIMCF